MSKINDLVKKLCPNGVEYKSLKDVFELFSGMTGVSNKWADEGNCRFIDYMNAYKNNKIDVTKLPYATVKNKKQTKLIQGDLLLTSASEVPDECAIASVIEDEIQDGIFMDDHLFGLRLKDEYKNIINTTFISYYLNSKPFRCNLFKAVRGVTRFYISNKDYMKLNIPIPPIEVQEEVVRILDKFGELEAELEADLEAELEARNNQYEFWRDKLFTSDNLKGIEDICLNISSGGTPNTSRSEYYGGNIPWLRTQEVNWNLITDTEIKITNEAIKHSSAKIIPANCVIVAMYGATVGRVAINNIPLSTNQACCNLEINPQLADYKYVFYWLSNQYKYIKSLGQGSQTNINAQTVKKIKIPLPSIEEQKRIVDILDKFDKLVNDITVGLQAEIELRKKQYEYYRNKLLSFEELSVSE